MAEPKETSKAILKHLYHAEATVLEGDLELPLIQEIKPQAYVKLPELGGYFSQRLENYRLGEVISFRSAHTQVAGNLNPKKDHGYSTLATSVIEGLNVLDVVTADRIIGQVITEIPFDGYVPHISFLGTRFENLRIAGQRVDVKLNLDILGARSENDALYTQNAELKKCIDKQFADLGEHKSWLDEMREGYHKLFPATASRELKRETLECSLVSEVGEGYPGQGRGHVIRIPGFGTIVLARVSLTHQDIEREKGILKATTVRLTMIDFKLGCPAAGTLGAGIAMNNGWPEPG
ncbi:MAG: hypothetical protein ABSD67_07740 [Terracidiphilus sp.]|jgi:hypothetical protein